MQNPIARRSLALLAGLALAPAAFAAPGRKAKTATPAPTR